MKEILKENCKSKVRIETNGRYNDEIYTCTNGWQWTGFTLTPRLAELMIEALKEYQESLIKDSEPKMKQPNAKAI